MKGERTEFEDWLNREDSGDVKQLQRCWNKASTTMRDKCVAQLRQIAADYDNVSQPNTGAAISKQAVLYAARQVESLALDQSVEKQKES